MNLETGKLYQVHNGKDWVIAEYVRTIEAHTERYFNLGSSIERSRKVPTRSYWKPVVGGWTFAADVKPNYLRPVTTETLAEIDRLRAESDRLRDERLKVISELKALCS